MSKVLSMKSANPRILTINGGSSSIKFALFESRESPHRIVGGSIERIGLSESTLQVKGSNEADIFSRPVKAPNHRVAVDVLMDWIDKRIGREGFTAVGHRIVQGGQSITSRSKSLWKCCKSCTGSAHLRPSICRRRSC
ncbi:hypothetical protein KIH39_14085 [Telmatocola sphagniphila]|uniref:Butyrate kinase n=1 Tax=Telmatocola sphagniphila TaxID=1123043 RepID=A0A8E6ETE7_9BACT|nr:hypothetical protein KIH39_14085 [Telmatocola sphagniphila]